MLTQWAPSFEKADEQHFTMLDNKLENQLIIESDT